MVSRKIILAIGLIIILYSLAFSCETNGIYPDASCTPGAIRGETTLKDMCTPNFTKTIRNVPKSLSKKVYESYGMNPKEKPCPCEVDHFISLVLGGSNDISNLWPETYSGEYGARQKDKLENFLHHAVCDGWITPSEAQREISTDWVKYYLEYELDKKGNKGNIEENEE